MILWTLITSLWNVLGDLAAVVFAWGWYWLVSQYLWRLPFVNVGWESFALWHLAIPLTLGFIVEHGGQLIVQILSNFQIGIHGEKGVTPFVVPAGLNWLVFLLWNLAIWAWPVMIIVTIVMIVFLVIRARSNHP